MNLKELLEDLAVSFELSEKSTFLNPDQAILFACLGHLVPRPIRANV